MNMCYIARYHIINRVPPPTDRSSTWYLESAIPPCSIPTPCWKWNLQILHERRTHWKPQFWFPWSVYSVPWSHNSEELAPMWSGKKLPAPGLDDVDEWRDHRKWQRRPRSWAHRTWKSGRYMDVSKNGGTQQPWVFLLKMIILGCFGGTPILETPIWR